MVIHVSYYPYSRSICSTLYIYILWWITIGLLMLMDDAPVTKQSLLSFLWGVLPRRKSDCQESISSLYTYMYMYKYIHCSSCSYDHLYFLILHSARIIFYLHIYKICTFIYIFFPSVLFTSRDR